MKHPRIYVAIAILVLPMLACQAVMGRGNSDMDDTSPATESSVTQPAQVQPTEPPTGMPAPGNDSGSSQSSVSTDFPMTQDAYNVIEAGDGSVIYYTKLSAEEAMQFYRDQYTAKGYTERKNLTLTADGMFSMVFDGDPGGKAVVIQSVDIGDGSRTISLRLEDV